MLRLKEDLSGQTGRNHNMFEAQGKSYTEGKKMGEGMNCHRSYLSLNLVGE